MTTITIPARVRSIMQQLLDSGHQAYIVGGCVRDEIMQRPVTDYDITTSATPEQIKEVFSQYKQMNFGEKHGTIAIHDQGQTYEITTYRIEEGYSDGRRPDRVTFVDRIELDLARRDFTINAMAADVEGALIDPYGGIDDISKKLIRAVGDPVARFTEDSLRILRAYRFSLRFDFSLDESTARAILQTNHLLIEHAITGERIGTEFNEILRYGGTGIASMHSLETLQTLFPFLHLEPDRILPRYQVLPTTSPDVNLAILVKDSYDAHIAHATEDLHPNKISRKFLSQLFEVVKGWGNYRMTKIKALLDHGTPPAVLLETDGSAELLRWIDRMFSAYESKHEFVYTSERDDLIAFSSAMLESDTRNLQSRIDAASMILAHPLPVSGPDAKVLGFDGPHIRDILHLWTHAAWYRGYTEPEQFIFMITNHWKNPELDLEVLRSEISDGSPKQTDEENAYLQSLIDAFSTVSTHQPDT